MKEIFAHRVVIIPWACDYEPVGKTLISNAHPNYEYAGFGSVGDVVWVKGLGGSFGTSLDEGLTGTGDDDRFSGLYVVEDTGNDGSSRPWRLRRHKDLDKTEQFLENPRIWLTDDSNNTASSDYGRPCFLTLPPEFRMGFNPGPKLCLIPTPTEVGNPS